VTLLGKWNFQQDDNIRLIDRTNKTTIIEVRCKDGLSYDIELNKL
jgi:hyaluronoglucosaminidase